MDIHELGSPAPRAGTTDRPDSNRRTADPSSPASLSVPLSAPGEAPQTEIARRIKIGGIASDRETLVRGRRAFERGDDENALESFARLAAHDVHYADVHYMTGLVQERRGELDKALASLKEAIRINPSYVEALLALASLHEHRGDYEQSARYAERASQLSRGSAGGLDPTTRGKLANQQAALADALARAGERREAIEEYRRALERCPTFHDIRHRLGIALREAGLPAQAAGEFKRILAAHPGLLESQVQLGLTYYSIGRTQEALREWNAVLEKDPSRDEARMYLRLVRGAGQESAATAEPRTPLVDSSEDLSFSAIPAAIDPTREDAPGWTKTALARSVRESSRGNDFGAFETSEPSDSSVYSVGGDPLEADDPDSGE